MNPGFSLWALPDQLVEFIITTFFDQTVASNTALIRGHVPTGQVYAWLYTADHYYPISLSDHEAFKCAACSRGTDYSIELCEFTVEETLPNGEIVINFWRRVGDDTGEGGRAILAYKRNAWVLAEHLVGWRSAT